MEKHTTGGEREDVFDEQTRHKLERILEIWKQACDESGLTLRLKNEADVSSQVDEGTLIGQIVSHFHPNGRPPTKQDEVFFKRYALSELRTVTDKGVYIYKSVER